MKELLEIDETAVPFYAGLICSMVEGIPLDEAFNRKGISFDDFIERFYSKKSSPESIEYIVYMAEELSQDYIRDDGSELYLIKKILCANSDFDRVAKEINSRDNKKFKVIKLIGSNPGVMKYKQDNVGMEIYLKTGKNALEALNKTSDDAPLFNFGGSDLRLLSYLGNFDKIVSKAIYTHKPEDVAKVFGFL